MFSKLSLLVTSVLATLAVANYPAPPTGTTNQCCTTVDDNSNSIVRAACALAGVDPDVILGDIGVSCSPILIASNQCSDTAVNCNANQMGCGLVNVNVACLPITF